jgi:uncharacterized protein
MFEIFRKPPWYAGGLAFQCAQCGRCCSGPEEGYVWVSDAEITRIAAFLGVTAEQVRKTYLNRENGRYTIIEQKPSNDCAFLQPSPDGSGKRCTIYAVRPWQCKAWPFWPGNLASADAWGRAGQRCKGMNRGELFGYEEIQSRSRPTDKT